MCQRHPVLHRPSLPPPPPPFFFFFFFCLLQRKRRLAFVPDGVLHHVERAHDNRTCPTCARRQECIGKPHRHMTESWGEMGAGNEMNMCARKGGEGGARSARPAFCKRGGARGPQQPNGLVPRRPAWRPSWRPGHRQDWDHVRQRATAVQPHPAAVDCPLPCWGTCCSALRHSIINFTSFSVGSDKSGLGGRCVQRSIRAHSHPFVPVRTQVARQAASGSQRIPPPPPPRVRAARGARFDN